MYKKKDKLSFILLDLPHNLFARPLDLCSHYDRQIKCEMLQILLAFTGIFICFLSEALPACFYYKW